MATCGELSARHPCVITDVVHRQNARKYDAGTSWIAASWRDYIAWVRGKQKSKSTAVATAIRARGQGL